MIMRTHILYLHLLYYGMFELIIQLPFNYDWDILNLEYDVRNFCLQILCIVLFRGWYYDQPGIGTLVNVRMTSLPSLRYQRNLLRTELDLVGNAQVYQYA